MFSLKAWSIGLTKNKENALGEIFHRSGRPLQPIYNGDYNMETNLIQVVNDEVFTTSLLVAEKFGKEHGKVLRAIDTIMSSDSIEPKLALLNSMFIKESYLDSRNREKPMYHINRDGFTLLAMGFTGAEALKWKLEYIEAFNTMEQIIHSGGVTDPRLEIAHMVLDAPEDRLSYLRDLYPEYFSHTPDPESLEYISDVNTSYQRWIEEYGVTKEWIGAFPTLAVYQNYMRFCMENNSLSMGKKHFYSTLESDFGMRRKQRANGYRYFISA